VHYFDEEILEYSSSRQDVKISVGDKDLERSITDTSAFRTFDQANGSSKNKSDNET